MELPRRQGDDIYLPDGTLRQTMAALREDNPGRNLRIGIFYAFDHRTRMLPYWYAETRMAPCSVRTLGDVLHGSGFEHIRIVLQQWSRNVKPSESLLDGRPLDVLLVSSMQVHAEAAYSLIRDAHRRGDERPLILAGGAKGIYEPTDFLEIGPKPGVGADCVCTGEAYVLLDLLRTLMPYRRKGMSALAAFRTARENGDLNNVPGLVFPPVAQPEDGPVAITTGVQRLLRDLDELPIPLAAYRLLEAPHRGQKMRPRPLPSTEVHRRAPIASLIATHGCKFNCHYCSIPAVNQRTWRHKSAARMAEEIKQLHETYGLKVFFGTDDNFFNNRDTVIELMTALRDTRTTAGKLLGTKIRFYTEATQFDVYKNRDLLDLCRKGGLRGIWFGIEDLTAELVKKGQNAGKTQELFATMNDIGIMPMAMLMHSDDQPLRAPKGNLSGLLNQARFMFDNGAISYQLTYITPMVGTRGYEEAIDSGGVFRSVNGNVVPEHKLDGNHVVASNHPKPWSKQLNLLRAYSTFYNPYNLFRSLWRLSKKSTSPKRIAYQVIGHIGLMYSLTRMIPWAIKLRFGKIEKWSERPAARIPLIDAHTGEAAGWAVEYQDAGPTTLLHCQPGHEAYSRRSSAAKPEIPLPVLQG